MLIRGLQNLESLPAREGFFVILFVPNKKYVKVLIGFVRSCSFGVLIRGLPNLDVLCKENELSLFASCKK